MRQVAEVITAIGSATAVFVEAAEAAVQEARTEYGSTDNIALAVERGGSGGRQMGDEKSDHGWKNWNDVSPGQLKHELEEAFSNAASGVYQALEVRVENPIREYRVLGPSS